MWNQCGSSRTRNGNGDRDVWSNWFGGVRIPFGMVVLDFSYYVLVVVQESEIGFPSSCEIFFPQVTVTVTVTVSVTVNRRGRYMQCGDKNLRVSPV